jgi:HTH-type transcriptional regulator/antitoxin HigA
MDGRMTANPGINQLKYGRLLAQTRPAVIESEEENERMLATIAGLMRKAELSPEESKLFDLLIKLIQDFEDKHYELHAATPLSILRELMECRKVKPRDLWDIVGSKSSTSEILSGNRSISKAQAKRLAAYFKVSVELFI